MGLLAPLWTQFRVKRSQAGWSGKMQSALAVSFQWPLLIPSHSLCRLLTFLTEFSRITHTCRSQRESENVYQSKEGAPNTERGHLRGMLLLAHANSSSSWGKGKGEKRWKFSWHQHQLLLLTSIFSVKNTLKAYYLPSTGETASMPLICASTCSSMWGNAPQKIVSSSCIICFLKETQYPP